MRIFDFFPSGVLRTSREEIGNRKKGATPFFARAENPPSKKKGGVGTAQPRPHRKMLSDPHSIRRCRIETTRSTAYPPLCALFLPVGECASALRRSCAQSFASRACLHTGQRQRRRAKPFFPSVVFSFRAYSIRATPKNGVFRILVLLCRNRARLYAPLQKSFSPAVAARSPSSRAITKTSTADRPNQSRA